jgi:hypothetical protein
MNARADDRTPDEALLHGRWLLLARAAWLGLALLILILVIAGIPRHFARLQTVCYLSMDVCIENGLLTPEMGRGLQQLGLSPTFWAAYILALNSVSLFVWCAVGTIIFVRKSDNRMALFIAFFLVTFGAGVVSSELLNALTNQPIWWLLVQCLGFLGNACAMLFAYLFPMGGSYRAGRAGWRLGGLRYLYLCLSSLIRPSIIKI